MGPAFSPPLLSLRCLNVKAQCFELSGNSTHQGHVFTPSPTLIYWDFVFPRKVLMVRKADVVNKGTQAKPAVRNGFYPSSREQL